MQIYAGKRKVLSAYPRGNAYRVPPGKLKRGTRYTWFVWAYRGTKGYVTRPMASYQLPEWLRVSVGTPAENERALAALRKVLGR